MKSWQGFRTIPPPAPALLLEFTHSQGTSTCCLPFFTPRSRNPIWVKRGWEERLTAKRSQDYNTHASLPRIARRFPSEPWVSIASRQTFWMGVQSDTRQAMLGEAPTTTSVQESIHVRAWRGRVGFRADFILAGFFYRPLCKCYSPTVSDRDMKSNKAKTVAH